MRFRRLMILGSVTALLASAWTPAQAGSRPNYRARILRLVNDSRAHNDIRRLDLNFRLSRYAKRHSAAMAERHKLFHTTNLQRRVRTYKASTWGENVGAGGTLRRIVRAWKASDAHRWNMLNRKFRKTGMGVVKRGGRFWVTQIFYG